MKRTGLLAVIFIIMATGCCAQMFEGVISFKDGRMVPFQRMGNDKPYTYFLHGKLGEQMVKYNLADLKEIILSGASANGNGLDVVVVSKQDKRFSLVQCDLRGTPTNKTLWSNTIYYRYLDPVTNKEQNGIESINNIAGITVGKLQGGMKKNPKTGEFFPFRYNYDPFTGEKLVWAKRDP